MLPFPAQLSWQTLTALTSAAQSGMGPSSSGSTQYSYTLTAVKLDVSDPLDAKVLGVYLYVGECWPRAGRGAGQGTPT